MASAVTQRTSIIPVTALVDWNSQIHAAPIPPGSDEFQIARRTLNYVCRVISNTLFAHSDIHRFTVTLRLYHGWHRGFEITARRKALVTIAAGNDALSTRSNVAFRPDVEFGDRLLSAGASRLHARLNVHLADTLRRSLRDNEAFEEKMVDTAIASDMVDLAHSEPQRWLILVGEDDDLIPPLIVADGIRSSSAGRSLIIRKRRETPFLIFKDLRSEP